MRISYATFSQVLIQGHALPADLSRRFQVVPIFKELNEVPEGGILLETVPLNTWNSNVR